jgi:hypothetical protein
LNAVPALAKADTERLLGFVSQAESFDGDEPVTGELLTELGRLVHADAVTYNELDRVRRRNLFYVTRPGDPDDELDDDTDALSGTSSSRRIPSACVTSWGTSTP